MATKDLFIRNVASSTHNELKTIARNLGIPATTLVKSKLQSICDSYPDKMKSVTKKD